MERLATRRPRIRRAAFYAPAVWASWFGVTAVLLSVVFDGLGAALWPGYSRTAQTISELLTHGAPNRLLLNALFAVYNLLLLGFALNLRAAARAAGSIGRWGARGALRVAGVALLGLLLIALPMDPRGASPTWVGRVHLVVAGGMAALALTGAAMTGLWLLREPDLRVYGVASFVAAGLMLLFGGLTILAARGPLFGLMERLIVATFEVWMLLVALRLARRPATGQPEQARLRPAH